MPNDADPVEFRSAMGRWATGVSVVTAHAAGHDAGLTVNAFLSVSLRPPVVLVSLTHDADTTPVVESSRRFGISVLASDQRALSERFAETLPSEEKFRGLAVRRGFGEVPLLEGALAHLECRLRSVEVVEDHRLLLGVVERVGPLRDAPPLLFYRSQYAVVAPDGRVSLPVGPK